MIIDVHAHYHPRAYNEALARITGRPAGGFAMAPHPDTDDPGHVERRLEMMDEASVGLQVISPAAGRAPYAADAAAAADAARICNDLTAQLVQSHPSRFKGFVSLPLPHVDAAIAEVERLVRRAEERGVTILIEACPEDYSNTIVTLEDTMRVLERIPSPRLQVLLDTGHVAVTATQLGRDPVAYFRAHVQAFGARLGHVHVDDNHGDTDAHLVPGAGDLDLAGMLAALQASGYDGWLSVELGILGDYVLPERAEHLLCESRAYLDGILAAGAAERAR